MNTNGINRTAQHVLIAFGNDYYRYVYVLLHSIFKNNCNELFCVHVLHDKLSSGYIRKMTQWVERSGHHITFYYVDAKEFSFCPINKGDEVPRRTYFRLFATRYLPNEIKKILYLDVDTCCVGSLKGLFETDMGDIPVMAVYGSACARRKENLGLTAGGRYYQGGVLLINLEYWRHHRCVEGLTKFIIEHHDHLERWDQDVINGYFVRKIGYLAPKYNVTSPFFNKNTLLSNTSPFFMQWLIAEKKEAWEHPVIIHFTGFDQMKPWWQDSTADANMRKIWLSYWKGSPCAEYKLKRFKKFHFMESISQWWGKIVKKQPPLETYLASEFRVQRNNYFKIKVKIEAAVLHPKTFGEFKGINQGKNFALCASGPSILHFGSTMIGNCRFCGVNASIKKGNIDFDYVFCQDHHFEKGKNESINTFDNGKCIKFYGKIENRRALTMDNNVDLQQLYKCKTHTHQLPFQDVLSTNARPYILSEYMGQMPYNIECEPIADVGGTVFSAMQFALYTNPKRIFLVGCDHTSGYFYDQQFKMFDASTQANTWVRFIVPHMKRNYPSIQIISINPVGLKGLFRDVYTESYLQEHPEIKNATLLKDILEEDP